MVPDWSHNIFIMALVAQVGQFTPVWARRRRRPPSARPARRRRPPLVTAPPGRPHCDGPGGLAPACQTTRSVCHQPARAGLEHRNLDKV
ncbi:hypothetical protein Q604_UNBC05281G0001, partial [human gut metagenome]